LLRDVHEKFESENLGQKKYACPHPTTYGAVSVLRGLFARLPTNVDDAKGTARYRGGTGRTRPD